MPRALPLRPTGLSFAGPDPRGWALPVVGPLCWAGWPAVLGGLAILGIDAPSWHCSMPKPASWSAKKPNECQEARTWEPGQLRTL